MFGLFKPRRLHFELAEGETDKIGLSLAEAIHGKPGCVYLGAHGNVWLWTPNNPCPDGTREAVCDLRFLPLEAELAVAFKHATDTCMMDKSIALFHDCDSQKIKHARTLFDVVLIPCKGVKNTLKDIHERGVLSYHVPQYYRHRQR